MSTPVNSTGYDKWDADIVAATSIALQLDIVCDFTADDTATPIPSHLYRSFATQTFNYTGNFTGTRVSPFATLATDEFAIQTGTVAIGEGPPPPLFRGTFAEFVMAAGGSISFTGSYSYTSGETFTGPGSPAPISHSQSGTITVYLTCEKTAQGELTWHVEFTLSAVDWLLLFPNNADYNIGDVVTIDDFTFKKGGSDNFGTTKNITATDPGFVYDFAGFPLDTTSYTNTLDIAIVCS